MEEVLERIARQMDEKRFGKYRAFVHKRNDPEKRGRLRLIIPSVTGSAPSGWALPCFPTGGAADQGTFAVPAEGAQVWAEFEEGNVSQPIWVGTFYQRTEDVPEAARLDPPTTYLFQTPGGHAVRIDEASGNEAISLEHSAGSKVTLDKKGGILLTDKRGAVVFLDAESSSIKLEDGLGNSLVLDSSGVLLTDLNRNEVSMTPSGLTLKSTQIVLDAPQVALGGGGGEPVILGQSLLSYLLSHVHPGTAGPTFPPTPPPLPLLLSMKVRSS
jgi:phage baseplate assembly protein gpV